MLHHSQPRPETGVTNEQDDQHAVPELVMQEVAMLTDTQPGLETEMQDEPAGQPDLEATLQGLGMLPCEQTDQHEQKDVLQLMGGPEHTQPGRGTEHAVLEIVIQEVAMLTDTQPVLETVCKMMHCREWRDYNITSQLLSSAKRMSEIPNLLDSPLLQLGLLRGMTVFH